LRFAGSVSQVAEWKDILEVAVLHWHDWLSPINVTHEQNDGRNLECARRSLRSSDGAFLRQLESDRKAKSISPLSTPLLLGGRNKCMTWQLVIHSSDAERPACSAHTPRWDYEGYES
jgi:hypothetical protein